MNTRFAHVWRLENGVPVAFETIADAGVMVDAVVGAMA